MVPILPLIGAGLGAINTIGRFFGGRKQKREAKKIKPIWEQYQTNPFANKQLGLANTLFNSRMAGAPQMEQNILSAQGNQLANINRNATDASQALALGAASQGTADEAFSKLGIMEAENKYNMLGNLNAAYGNLINEGDKEYQSKLMKYKMDVDRKDALMASGANNQYGAVSDMSSLAFGLGGLFGNNPFARKRKATIGGTGGDMANIGG